MLTTTTNTLQDPVTLIDAVRSRRATQSFKPDPVPEHILREILELSVLAPSGYNLQPWRFIVVRDPEKKRKLRQAAMGQKKVEEAPVVIIACANPAGWRSDIDAMLDMSSRMGNIPNEDVRTAIRRAATGYLESVDTRIWATKQTMIAFTYLMLLAESYGLDTAPMEGFWEDKVKEAFAIPEEMLVLALLAIGYAGKPDRAFDGRFDLQRIFSSESFGSPLQI